MCSLTDVFSFPFFSFAWQVLRQLLAEQPATLILMSSYHIGKERAYFAAAEALNLKVGPGDGKGKGG